jgi:hypothetical protein
MLCHRVCGGSEHNNNLYCPAEYVHTSKLQGNIQLTTN